MIAKNMLDPEKLTKQLDDIDKTLVRISKIISGLKNVSRDTTHETISKHIIGDVIGDSLAVCSEKFKINGVKINIDIESSIFKTEVNCYRVQLSQVFFNLLGNAYDAVEKNEFAWVSIQGKIVDSFLEIRLMDSGTGIPLEIQSKIFQPFYTTKPVGKGTGLGLSLCNSIIKRHNGEFFIDNESTNTCFVIRLPLEMKL
jgi:signal transduction histidine kinase